MWLAGAFRLPKLSANPSSPTPVSGDAYFNTTDNRMRTYNGTYWAGRLGVYNALDYGAVGDGTTDNASVINSLITAVPAGSSIYFPAGTYRVNSQITVGSSLNLFGDGPSSILLGNFTGVGTRVVHLAASDILIHDLLIDGGGGADIRCLDLGAGTGSTYSRVTIQRVGFTRCSTSAFVTYAGDTLKDLWFVDNIIRDATIGTNGAAIVALVPTGGGSSEGIVIARNTWKSLTTASTLFRALQIDGAAQVDSFKRVTIANNVFEQLDATNGIPIEVTGCTDIVISGNTIGPNGSRGISTGWCKKMAITGNAVSGQALYAIELNGGSNITISGNAIDNCDSFVIPTNATLPVTDVVISGNEIVSSGYLAQSQTASIWVYKNAARWTIIGNQWKDSKTTSNTGVIRVGNASDTTADVTISNNTYLSAASDADANFISIRSGAQVRVTNNTVTISRATGTGFNGFAAIYVSTNDANCKNVTIDGNVLRLTGTNTATTFDGIDDGAASAYTSVGLAVTNNMCVGFNRGLEFTNDAATDAVFWNNNTVGCTGADVVNTAARSLGNPVVQISLAGDFNTSSTTAVATPLAFTIGKNETWICRISMDTFKSNANGMVMQIKAPTGSVLKGWSELGAGLMATARTIALLPAINTNSATFTTGNGVTVSGVIEFTVLSSTTAGTISLAVAAVTNGTCTVLQGSSLIAHKSRTV